MLNRLPAKNNDTTLINQRIAALDEQIQHFLAPLTPLGDLNTADHTLETYSDACTGAHFTDTFNAIEEIKKNLADAIEKQINSPIKEISRLDTAISNMCVMSRGMGAINKSPAQQQAETALSRIFTNFVSNFNAIYDNLNQVFNNSKRDYNAVKENMI